MNEHIERFIRTRKCWVLRPLGAQLGLTSDQLRAVISEGVESGMLRKSRDQFGRPRVVVL
jgi:hypothetical protein